MMSGAAPVAQNPAHEKVNAVGVRSELTDTTAGAHPGFGFSLRASAGVAGPISVPLHHGWGGWGWRRAAPGGLGLTRVAANHGLKERSWRWRHKSFKSKYSILTAAAARMLFFLFRKTTSDPGKHAGGDTRDAARLRQRSCLDSCCLCCSCTPTCTPTSPFHPTPLPQPQGFSDAVSVALVPDTSPPWTTWKSTSPTRARRASCISWTST